MTLEILPLDLHKNPQVTKVFVNGKSSILHKTLYNNIINQAIYTTTHLIIFIKNGKQIIKDINGLDNKVIRNNLIFLPPGLYSVSDYIVEKDGKFEAILFFFDGSVIEKYLTSTDNLFIKNNKSQENNLDFCVAVMSANKQIQSYIESIFNVYNSSIFATTTILELKLLEMLNIISIENKLPSFFRELDDKTNGKKCDITDFMGIYYSHKLKVEDYALLTGRSVSTFIRDFKFCFGITPNKWIIDKKINEAQKLIVQKNYSVTEAAFEVGYGNVSHFIKAYKLKFGLTPKKTKKNIQALS